MELAGFLGEPSISKLVRSLSHREYTTWQEWLRQQWNKPSRTDYYLMQLTAVVRSLGSKTPVSIDSCKIPWNWEYVCSSTGNPNLREEYQKSMALAFEQRTMAALGVQW